MLKKELKSYSSKYRSSFAELCKPRAIDGLIVTATPQECTLSDYEFIYTTYAGALLTSLCIPHAIVMYAVTGSSSESVAAFRKASWKKRELKGKRVKSETNGSAVSHLWNNHGKLFSEWFASDSTFPEKLLELLISGGCSFGIAQDSMTDRGCPDT